MLNRPKGYPVRPGKRGLRHPAGRVRLPDGSNLLGGKFRRPAPAGPSSAYRVAGIVEVCADQQVCRVDAGRVVACVSDEIPVGDGADEQFVSDSTGSIASPPVRQVAVTAVGVNGPLPYPAEGRWRRGPWHVVPEVISGRLMPGLGSRRRVTMRRPPFVVLATPRPGVGGATAMWHGAGHSPNLSLWIGG